MVSNRAFKFEFGQEISPFVSISICIFWSFVTFYFTRYFEWISDTNRSRITKNASQHDEYQTSILSISLVSVVINIDNNNNNIDRSFQQADKKQENKVTITLIAVVILFLICQTPNTLQMLNIMQQSQYKNKQRGN